MNFAELEQRAKAWRDADPDPSMVEELSALLTVKDHDALFDRFRSELEFGTAGLRGLLGAGPNRMNRAVVRRTTAGLARYLKATVPDVQARGVVVGRDGRRLSAELAEDTACVLAAEGIPALVLPPLSPTPVTAFAVRFLKAAAGVMVTASHNPPEYNGYKVYWGNGAQIVPPHDRGIAEAISRVELANQIPLLDPERAREMKRWRDLGDEVEQAYLQGIEALRLRPTIDTDLRIVYTALHGVGGRWAVAALKAAGFQKVFPVPEQQEPDGAFPTVRFPNPEEPGAMDLSLALARTTNADLVLANDPDADRLAVMVRSSDGEHRALSGNETGVLLGHYLLTQQEIEKPLVITTIVSSAQLGVMARELGAAFAETLTGFKWVANKALALTTQHGYRFVFGYEEALGYTIGTLVNDKDGISAALLFAELAGWCKARGTTVLGYLESIQRRHGLFVSHQRNFTFEGAAGATTMATVMRGFRESPPRQLGSVQVKAVVDYLGGTDLPPSDVIALVLEDDARITIRPSGTEPKLKYYFEVKETLAETGASGLARERALDRIKSLEAGLLAAAKERGQP